MNFKDQLGANLNVGDIIVCGVKNGHSTPGVTLGRILRLHSKSQYEPRCFVSDDLSIKTIEEFENKPHKGYGLGSYRYCERVYLLAALVDEAESVLKGN